MKRFLPLACATSRPMRHNHFRGVTKMVSHHIRRASMLMGLFAILAACSPQQQPALLSPTVISAPSATGSVSNIDQVNRGVAAAEQTLTLLYQAALAYTSLPRCGTGPRICSDLETVRQIRRYAIQAHNALIAARRNESSVEMVWMAINAFRAVVPAS